ncbi:MAG TPA: GcrA family cell cycle regulator [Bosea sp. (in: a-proteobacteria)]|jgi:GcrA cell cycle regulator|uniref:GcrA family cell cycle regulator n=1 Tax=Bosea sp. (in: a-proteobacteria) TaxID=1871050 RepID=UPI002E122C40|nr:GcrA family cell cycle regulator [Bosea sp. (in: a-proteobacteria)]
MPAAKFQWTDEAVAAMKRLRAGGKSFTEVALAIGCPSRSAVIGKAHRLGMERIPVAKRESKAASIPKPKAPKPERLPRAPKQARLMPAGGLPKDPEKRREVFQGIADRALGRFDETVAASRPDSDAGVLFMERGRFQCAMPMPGWDAASIHDKRVCGAAVAMGTSYCPACVRIVYAPPALREFKDRNLRSAA